METFYITDIMKATDLSADVIRFILEPYTKLETNSFLVYPWEHAPKEVRNLCPFNGGDEDWMVITNNTELEYLPSWLENMGCVGAPDKYMVGLVCIYVCSHA